MSVKVPQKVYEGLKACREDGSFNMFEFKNVQYLANVLGEYETVVWIQENENDYIKGIFEGFEPEETA